MISDLEIHNKLEWLNELLLMFVQFENVKEEDFTLSVPELINIIIDVDEEIRKIRQFHSLSHVSIARELSLYCFYILKRKPIIIIDRIEYYGNQINERFCVFILLSSTVNIGIWDEEYIQFLVSMFYNGELSKDAIYLLAITMHQMDKSGEKADGN